MVRRVVRRRTGESGYTGQRYSGGGRGRLRHQRVFSCPFWSTAVGRVYCRAFRYGGAAPLVGLGLGASKGGGVGVRGRSGRVGWTYPGRVCFTRLSRTTIDGRRKCLVT